ncbi:MAG: alpha/beta hydrolase [Candidatus Saccharibacteria bacterium]
MSIRHQQGKTAYWVYNDDPKLATIVMIHGLRGTHHGLDLVAKELTNFRVIVPDLPGFSESEPFDKEHSIDNYVVWLNEFISGLELRKKPFLMGHSFGSIIVSSYVSQYPESVEKLILVNPIGSTVVDNTRSISSKLAIGYYWLSEVTPEKIGNGILSAKPIVMITSLALTKTRDKKLRKWIHSQHMKYFSTYANRRTVNEAFKASIKNSVRDFAANIAVPTLVIAGELDNITPLKKQKELVSIFPNSRIIVIKNVGHLTQYETPDEIVKAITNFLT